MNLRNKYPKVVLYWLLVGVIMVFVQVVLGGITRLTESGLSITKWDIVSGTLPPLTESDWLEAFEMYKATPQYAEINEGMSFSDFKFIYFWEYVHRLWARLMGFVFLFPFLYFMTKRYFDKEILINLSKVILLSILAATFGWIMVASGLVLRPWVNAYKLSLHLIIAFSVYIMLIWTYFQAKYFVSWSLLGSRGKMVFGLFRWFGLILFIQIFLGGILSGMRAAVVFPTWPDMSGELIPKILFKSSEWSVENFNEYDKSIFMPALIHFMHRCTAYILVVLAFIFMYNLKKTDLDGNNKPMSSKIILFLSIGLLAQVGLGILTVVNSKGSVPVGLGVMHQAGAMLLVSITVVIFFILRPNQN
jgi:cytochrome c oxidase assembly protein subunit 15